MSNKAVSDLAAATVETRPELSSPVEKVADLLRGASTPTPDNPETGSPVETEGEQSPTSPETDWGLKAVAERLQVDPETLYEQLKVAFDDGTELSVSALKDAHRPIAEIEKARGELLAEVEAERRDVSTAKHELGVLVQHLGQSATPELLREIGSIAEKQRREEAEKLLKALPDWKDPIKRAADWSDIRRVAREIGFTDTDLKLAEAGFADHRMLVLLKRAAKVTPEAKPPPKVAVAPKATKPPTQAQQFGQLKAAVTTGRMRPEEAAARLLRGTK